MISDHRRATLIGNKQEKRGVARQFGQEGAQLVQMKQNRAVEERKRDLAEVRQMHARQAAQGAAQDEYAANRRQQAVAAAAENRLLAEQKRRNEFAARVRIDLKEETEVTRNKYKIQSGIIR